MPLLRYADADSCRAGYARRCQREVLHIACAACHARRRQVPLPQAAAGLYAFYYAYAEVDAGAMLPRAQQGVVDAICTALAMAARCSYRQPRYDSLSSCRRACCALLMARYARYAFE